MEHTKKLECLNIILDIITKKYTLMDVTISTKRFFINIIENNEFDEETLELIRDLDFVYLADINDYAYIIELEEL